MRTSLHRAVVGTCLFVLGVLACSSRDTPEEKAGKTQERLTQTELARILSFEGTLGTSGDWIKSGGTVVSSTLHASVGTHSMVLSGTPSISVTSTALSALGSVGTKMTLDLWLPSALVGQPNKGNLQAFLDSPALQLYSYATSNVALAPLTPGQFSRVEIPLDSSLRSKLSQSGYSDLKIKFTFNLANTTQTFVDNLVFSSAGTGAGGGTSTGGASAIGGTTAIGGARAAGGAGGLINSGGAPGNGGAGATGATANTGSSPSLGGSNNNAGGNAPSNGGAPTSGATSGIGLTATGGMTTAGGTASGGVSTTSGSITGGSSATGGTNTTGRTGATGGTDGSGGGTSYTFSFKLPAGVSRNQVVFATTEGDLSLEDGVNAYDASGYASVSAVNAGKVNRIGVASQVQNVWSDGDVTLANDAVVHGSLWTSGEFFSQAGAKVLGNITEFADLSATQSVSWSVDFPSNSHPPISITAAQVLSPGHYPEYDIKTAAQLDLSNGTYTFDAMIVEPGATLNIDNRQGPVFVYLRDGFTFRGNINPAVMKANVLFGSAGTSPVIIDSAFTGIVFAPQTSITLATVPTQHTGAFFGQSIIARKNTAILLNALDSSNFCTASDPCSSFCPCAAGTAKSCSGDSSCATGVLCGTANGAAFGLPATTNVCWPASCAATGGVGSGCGRFPRGCQSDSDCSSGEVCGASNGAQFQFVAARLCWLAQCDVDPVGTGCATIHSPCGLCPSTCTPNCSSKKCGDAPDDGCGGTCSNYCKDGTAGCTADEQCRPGSVCSAQAAAAFGRSPGAMACWPAQCIVADLAQSECAKSKGTCGTVCPTCTPDCSNQQCGVDPVCGQSCGTCASGQFCDPSGQCQTRSKDIIGSGQAGGEPGTNTEAPIATDVGAIPGTFSVTPQGKAHYSVPLFVPPGVNGMTPRLSLEYESTVRDGEVGVGWSIGGLSVIARCPKNYAEGGPLGISYTQNDQFCLDGTPLLRVTNLLGDGAEYRTETDSMVRIFAHYAGGSINSSGPDHFDVYSPDGRLSRYGGKGQYSIWSATGQYGEWSGDGFNRTWALTHVEDIHRNTIEYLYELDGVYTVAGESQLLPGQPSNGTLMTTVRGTRPVLYEILYGGTTDVPGNRKITFDRQHLWDDSQTGVRRYGYHAGAPFESTERISKIAMYYEEAEVRSYFLQYESDVRRSKLAELFECAQGHCKQPTRLTYKPRVNIALPQTSDTTPLFGSLGLMSIETIFDANGDGRMDFILNPNRDPHNSIDCSKDRIFARAIDSPFGQFVINSFKPGYDSCKISNGIDWDNDGRDELYGFPDTGTIKSDCDNNGNWQSSPTGSGISYGRAADYNGDGFIEWSRELVDIDTNGDGVPDGITYGNYGKFAAKNVNGDAIALGAAVPSYSNSALEQDAYIRSRIGTKDCAPKSIIGDAVRFDFGCSYANFSKVSTWTNGMKWLDVNGDGLKDLMTWSTLALPEYELVPSLFVNLWVNTGRYQFVGGYPIGPLMDPSEQNSLDSFLNAGSFKQSFVYDVNQDGLEDLVIINAMTKQAFALVMVPDATLGAKVSLVSLGGETVPDWFTEEGNVLTLDLDSDGTQDLIFGDGVNIAVKHQVGSDHDLLASIIDGNGRVDNIEYVSGKAKDNYTESLPQTSISKPVHVLPPTVASHSTGTTASQSVTERYRYKDGRVGFYGRGFLGFTEIEKSLSTSELGKVSTETASFHPDTLQMNNPEATAQNPYVYYESGRPWKKVVATHALRFGIGDSATGGDHVVTETRALRGIVSDAHVPMWVPDTDTVTESLVDWRGGGPTLSTTVTKYEFDQYGQPTYVAEEKYVGDETPIESRKTTTSYRRDQLYIDKWLIKLPAAITTIVMNDGDTVTHAENRYYDGGRLERVDSEPDDPRQATSTIFLYNARGNVRSVIRQAGDVTAETDSYYDSADDQVELTVGPLVNSMSFAYFRGYGQISSTMDANGLTTSRKIDAFGREQQTRGVNDETVDTSYELPATEATYWISKGREVAYAVRKTSTGHPTVLTFHDAFNRPIGTYATDSDGITVLTESVYDSLGRKVRRSHRPFSDSNDQQLDEIQYDNLNRAVKITVASDTGAENRVQYGLAYGAPGDDLGPLLPPGGVSAAMTALRTTYPNGSEDTKLLDAHSRVVAMLDRNGGLNSYSYGAAGNLLRFKDQSSLTTEYQYDRQGRPTSITDPIRGTTTIKYSPLGDIVEKTTPTGRSVTHYDLLNRPITEESPDGSTLWLYDREDGARGKLVAVLGPATSSAPSGHSVHYSYGLVSDAAGGRGMLRQVTNTIGEEQFDVDYDYDSLGRTKAIHYPAVSGGLRYVVDYEYTAAGRLSKVVEGEGGLGRTLWEITARDSFGRTTAAQALSTMSVGYAYTNIEGLLSQLTASESGQQKVQLDYQYDVDDNVTGIGWREDGEFSGRSRLYEYDIGGRFTDEYKAAQVNGALQRDQQSQPLHVEYGPNGNILSKSDVGVYTYDEPGNPYAVTDAGGYAYRYDSIGRQIERMAPYIPSGGEKITWTQFDAPATVTSADGVKTSYEYNGQKERVLELGLTRNKVSVGGAYQRIEDLLSGQRTHSMLVSAGSAVIAEVEFVDNGPSSATAQGPTVTSIVSDKLGSTSIVRDPLGSYIKRSYDAFGKASTMASPLKSGIDFAGYTQDSNTNLLWMNNRPYDAVIGRVLLPDPVINGAMGQDGANRYAYVYNRPTTFIDPSGFDGFYYDPSMDYSFDYSYSPDYNISFGYSNPNMSMGTAGYYVPPVQMSYATPDATYAGGQSYAGESGNWGGGGGYSADAYASYITGQYGATGIAMGSQQAIGYSIPLSWYENDLYWQYAQYGSAGLGAGALIAATYAAAVAAAPVVYSYVTGASAGVATSPELVGTGTVAAKYAVDNAQQLESVAPRVGSMAAEGGGFAPLIYGPSAGGDLASTAARFGGQTLTDFVKPTEMGWEAFSKQTLDVAAATGRQVIFDLTDMQNIPGVLRGAGQFANTVTGAELRYIQANWTLFQGNVTFISSGAIVSAPW